MINLQAYMLLRLIGDPAITDAARQALAERLCEMADGSKPEL